jgi:hypothetical protein
VIDVAAICIGLLGGALALINGVYMLVSPRAWLGLPGWLRGGGPPVHAKYSTGGGALQIRFAGGLIVAFFVLVSGHIVYDEFFRAPFDESSADARIQEVEGALTLAKAGWVLVAVLSVFMTINGAVMVASPSAWETLPRWLKTMLPSADDLPSPWRSAYVRVIGVMILLTVGGMM